MEDLQIKPGTSLKEVCEPCLQGKQHRAVFPHTANRSSELLGRVFSDVHGCAAYVLIGRDKRRGLQGHTQSGIFVGYPDNYVGWKVYIPSTRKIVISRNVVFDESRFPGLKVANMPAPPALDVFNDLEEYAQYNWDDLPQSESIAGVPANQDCAFNEEEPLTDVKSDAEGLVGVSTLDLVGANVDAPLHTMTWVPCQPRPLPPPCKPSQRICFPAHNRDAGYLDAVQHQQDQVSPLAHKPPLPPPPSPSLGPPPDPPLWNIDIAGTDKQEVALTLNIDLDDTLLLAGHVYVEYGSGSGEYAMISANVVTANKVGAHDTNPRSYKEAMMSDNAAEWYKAMCEEMNALKNSGTWRSVYLPEGCRAIGSQWVFKVKHLPDGAIEQFKA